jgi:hypothetical protein
MDDLVPALAQMCIKALALDVRDDDSTVHKQRMPIRGVLMNDTQIPKGENGLPPLTLRDALNKIIHGTPTSVEVRDDDLRLYFSSTSPGESRTKVWFSGTQLLRQFDRMLYKHGTKELRSENGRFDGSSRSSELGGSFLRVHNPIGLLRISRARSGVGENVADHLLGTHGRFG